MGAMECFRVQSGLSEKFWESSDGVLLLCETYQTIWQTERHRMKEDLELHSMVY